MKTVDFYFDETEINSPFVERIWCTSSTKSGTFISQAVSNWEIAITKFRQKTTVTLLGPETKATRANCPANAEFVGIQFKVGTYIPRFHLQDFVDGHFDFDTTSKTRFGFDGTVWEIPNYENADVFVAKLFKEGLLVHDPVIAAALDNRRLNVTNRTIQRRFKHVTGLTHREIKQIERAKYAVTLLQDGVSILDTVFQAGYADQSHLTRALKRFIGQTPGQILRIP